MNVSHTLTSDQYLVTHAVGPHQHGIRLDNFLKERYRKRSREQLKKAIDSGAITVKRTQGPHLMLGKAKPSSHLIPGDEVLVLTERKPEPEVCFDYKILYEDDVLFVINKPAQLPVHPAGRYFFNTLLIHLKTEGHKNPLRSEEEYYLAHRIDKETSGVLVLTKDKDVCADITRQFAERKTKKRYLAIVRGICPESFEVGLPLRRATHSLIELKMITCDKLYGMPETEALRFYERKHLTPEAEAKLLLPRHALHAASLEFFHPLLKKSMIFEAPLPQDMRDFIAKSE
ncbi:RluA family pseudouridine synthase [bacterium]|nr:RluA family pseudouridine synthase [bacterium]